MFKAIEAREKANLKFLCWEWKQDSRGVPISYTFWMFVCYDIVFYSLVTFWLFSCLDDILLICLKYFILHILLIHLGLLLYHYLHVLIVLFYDIKHKVYFCFSFFGGGRWHTTTTLFYLIYFYLKIYLIFVFVACIFNQILILLFYYVSLGVFLSLEPF